MPRSGGAAGIDSEMGRSGFSPSFSSDGLEAIASIGWMEAMASMASRWEGHRKYRLEAIASIGSILLPVTVDDDGYLKIRVILILVYRLLQVIFLEQTPESIASSCETCCCESRHATMLVNRCVSHGFSSELRAGRPSNPSKSDRCGAGPRLKPMAHVHRGPRRPLDPS